MTEATGQIGDAQLGHMLWESGQKAVEVMRCSEGHALARTYVWQGRKIFVTRPSKILTSTVGAPILDDIAVVSCPAYAFVLDPTSKPQHFAARCRCGPWVIDSRGELSGAADANLIQAFELDLIRNLCIERGITAPATRAETNTVPISVMSRVRHPSMLGSLFAVDRTLDFSLFRVEALDAKRDELSKVFDHADWTNYNETRYYGTRCP